VVDHDSGPFLVACVQSLAAESDGPIVVVENGRDGSTQQALQALEGDKVRKLVAVVQTGRNLGYGAGANRGLAALDPRSPYVLVCNPDVRLHPGAVDSLVATLQAQPTWALVGPRIVNEDGSAYPSARPFPSMVDAAGHALFALFNPENRFSRRYRPAVRDDGRPVEADWVSGACFLARRSALEELGGFDEAYFMYAEDMDLCWRARQAGWAVGFDPSAEIAHIQGTSTSRHPYRMLMAHHRSAFRFAVRTTKGWRRLVLPLAAVVLCARMTVASLQLATSGSVK
jgi:N-acetylglucosaminyl-diphospho-decaprenol L-rhamnosyltransferase